MKRLLMLLAATALASPAIAQHSGHNMPGHTMPMPKAKAKPKPKSAAKPAPRKKPAAKAPARAAKKAAPKPAAKKDVVKKPAKKAAAPKPAADPHAGHQMAPAAAPAADPHAGHQMAPATAPVADPHAGHQMAPVAAPAADPHAGHVMPDQPSATPADPHAGHDMGAMQAATPAPPVLPPPVAALSGPANAADAVYGADAMSGARRQFRNEHGNIVTYKVLIDRLETRISNGRDGYAWDGEAWYGGDIDKLWIKSEGEGDFGSSPESAEVQALWSHALDPWFNLQTGVRYDFRPNPGRAHLVLGVQGLAPYWFEVDGALFLSEKGDLTARFEAEYDQRITQQLILQPRIEFDLAAQDVAEIGIGSGLSTAEAGLRLRYEISPEFAPYIGVQYERAFGDTRDFRRAAGEDTGGFGFLIGLRTWF